MQMKKTWSKAAGMRDANIVTAWLAHIFTPLISMYKLAITPFLVLPAFAHQLMANMKTLLKKKVISSATQSSCN